MNWRTTPVTLPHWLENADLPADLTEVDGFAHHANDAALDIEAGGTVELQRVNASGVWETFETTTQTAEQVMVANRPAIRFVPVADCNFRLSWTR